MLNRVSKKRNIDADIFKRFLKSRETSIRQIGRETDITERTIRRNIQEGCVTITTALILCDYFNTDCNTMFGPDDSSNWTLVKSYLN